MRAWAKNLILKLIVLDETERQEKLLLCSSIGAIVYAIFVVVFFLNDYNLFPIEKPIVVIFGYYILFYTNVFFSSLLMLLFYKETWDWLKKQECPRLSILLIIVPIAILIAVDKSLMAKYGDSDLPNIFYKFLAYIAAFIGTSLAAPFATSIKSEIVKDFEANQRLREFFCVLFKLIFCPIFKSLRNMFRASGFLSFKGRSTPPAKDDHKDGSSDT